MSRLRWRKLLRDVRLTWVRTAVMVVAIAVSVVAVAAFLTGRAVVDREIDRNYLAGDPASATLHVPSGVGAGELRVAAGVPGVVDVAARGTLVTRVRVGTGPWRAMVLFVSSPDDPQRLARQAVERGTWPPPAGGVLLERTAFPFLGVDQGATVQVRAPGSPQAALSVTGRVHDSGVAPAYQERTVYGYASTTTLPLLGRPQVLDEVKILAGTPGRPEGDQAAVTATAQKVAAALRAAGHPVTSIDVPPPLRHPHYGQSVTVGFIMIAFAVVALLLSSVLVATMLGGMMSAQVRQIGAMKAVGARTGQLLTMYLLQAAGIAVAATLLAVAPGLALGGVMARTAGDMLNLDVASTAPPAWVLVVVLCSGVLVPLLAALPPLVRGARRTVREAIDDHGSDPAGVVGRTGARLGRLPGAGRSGAMALRGLGRRPGRLVLTVGLLAVAGSGFLTGLNGAAGWDGLVQAGVEHRHYDVQVLLARPVPADRLLAAARAVPGVTGGEAWAAAPTTVHEPGRVDVAHVYPDESHNSFTMMAPPAGTPLITPQLRSGRWLRADDTDAVVLTNLAVAQQLPGTAVGDTVTLTVGGRVGSWRVVGIASEFGTQGTAYVTDRELAVATGDPGGARVLRLTTDGRDGAARRAVLDRLTDTLDAAGLPVASVVTTDELRSALDGHVFVLVEAMVVIALVVGFVGLLGLGSAMSTSVIERTREYGVMHALGATAGAIRQIVVTEGVLTALAALVVAASAAVPLSAGFGSFLGANAFKQPLPFTYSPAAVLLWTVLTLSGAVVATAAAARRASRLTVREALGVL